MQANYCLAKWLSIHSVSGFGFESCSSLLNYYLVRRNQRKFLKNIKVLLIGKSIILRKPLSCDLNKEGLQEKVWNRKKI